MSTPWNGEPDSALSLSAGIRRASVGDGKPPTLSFGSGHERADQRYARVPLQAIGDDGEARRLEARDVRDAPLTLQPPRDLVVAVAAEAHVLVHRPGLLGDPAERDAVFVERDVVRAHVERVPLVVQLGPVT